MHHSYRIRAISVICFMIVLLLAGCARESAGTEASQEVASPHPATTSPIPTLSFEPTRTVPPPTATPPTPTTAATATLAPQQILDEVRYLFDENGGCSLPCWWGIEPGKTTWEEALAILSPLAMEIFPPWPLGGNSPSLASRIAYDILIPVSPDIYPVRLDHRYVVQDDVVQKIELEMGKVARYQLSKILNDLGQPYDVWISTYSMALEGSLPFSAMLYYPQQAVLVHFASEAEVEGDFVVGCPQDAPAFNLVLWRVEKQYKSFDAVVNDTLWLGSFNDWNYQRLENVTDIDPASFFETFKVAGNTTCIKSKAEHWPSPYN